MTQTETASFSRYGSNFQTKLLQSLLTDVKFFDRIFDILELEYFDSKVHNYLYEKFQSYFKQYKTSISIDNLEIQVLSERDELLREQAHEILRTIKKASAADVQFIKDESIKFCRNQNMKKALYKSIDLWEAGNYDDIWKIIGNAVKAGEESQIGHDYWNELALEYRVGLMRRSPISTGLKDLDIVLNGGLSKGELGTLCGYVSSGKSWFLAVFGANAVLQKKKVVHYTLELYEHQVGLRYDTIFTGIPSDQISNNVEFVKKKLAAINSSNNLIIKHYSTKKASVNTLRLHYDKLVQTGFIPDLIIVDYGDLLKPAQKYDQRRHNLEEIYEDLRGLAGELAVPVWTGSQITRSSGELDVVTLESIAEAFAKAAISDVIVTLSRKIEDKIKNTGRLFVAKNRAGKDGIIIPITMNLSNYKIETQKPLDNLDDLKQELQDLSSIKNGDELSGYNKKKYGEFQKTKEKIN